MRTTGMGHVDHGHDNGEKKHDRKIYARPRIHYIVGGVRFLVLAKYGDGVDSTKDSR